MSKTSILTSCIPTVDLMHKITNMCNCLLILGIIEVEIDNRKKIALVAQLCELSDVKRCFRWSILSEKLPLSQKLHYFIGRQSSACFTISFLGQFRKMSSQFNREAILFRAKSNATEVSFDFVLWLVKGNVASFDFTK